MSVEGEKFVPSEAQQELMEQFERELRKPETPLGEFSAERHNSHVVVQHRQLPQLSPEEQNAMNNWC